MMGDNICDNTGHSGGRHPGERGHWPGHEGYAALWHIVMSAAACHIVITLPSPVILSS